MLTLGSQDRFMPIDRLLFYKKDNVCKSRIIDYRPHIANKTIHGLIVNFIFLELSDV